jgi:hypothetical protein
MCSSVSGAVAPSTWKLSSTVSHPTRLESLISLLWKPQNLLIEKILKELSRLTFFNVSGQEVLVHKTFHCYTVRARQGGTQSSRDGRSGGSHPKSAGASLRRYNEAALIQVFDRMLWSV